MPSLPTIPARIPAWACCFRLSPLPTHNTTSLPHVRPPAQAPAPTGPVKEPDSVRLSNGVRLPMIGFGTAMIKDPQVIK